MRGFINTLRRIYYCDGVNSFSGILKHFFWQRRKLNKKFRVVLNISNSKIFGSNHVGVEVLVNCMGIYDYNNMSFIKLILNNGSNKSNIFIDAGSNIGSYTLIASETKNTKVISIEPHYETYNKLIENINLNKRENIIPLNYALTNKNCMVKITDELDSTKNRILNSNNLTTGQFVIGKTLDTICQELNILPTSVKIDVEGFEEQVLQGFKNKSHKVKFMIIESGDNSGIIKIMKEMSFYGPYYVHFKKKYILNYPHSASEDPIFLRKDFIDKLKKYNFEFIN